MNYWFQQDHIRPYIRLLCRILLSIIVFFLIARLLPVFFSFFFPFIFAFLAASALNPLICILQEKWKIPRSILSILMVIVALLVVAGILGGFLYTLGREVVALAQNIDGILEYFSQTILAISAHMNWLLYYMPTDTEEILNGLMDGFLVWIQTQGTAFADAVITQTVAITTRVGGGVVSLIIFVMSSYFMMTDYPRLVEKLRALVTKKAYRGYAIFKNATLAALGGYLKAQFVMALATFAVSLVAFLIIGQEFALLLAVLMGVLDIIPVIGTSIVLVPWGIINIIGGAPARGIYLLALSLVAFLIRRVIEPKVVGSQMGLSPLMALISIYIGMQLGGVLGLILGPIVAMVLVSLYKSGVFEGWIGDINEVIDITKKWK